MVDAHRLAKISHTPPVRSPVTPVARGSATPTPTGNRPLAVPHSLPPPLPGFADPLSPGPRAFSATDVLPDDSPARLRLRQVRDPNFSDIEDDNDGDGSAFLSDDTHAPAAVPAAPRPYVNVVCGARRDSVRIGRYHYTQCPYRGMGMLAVQIAERRAELAFLRSTWPRASIQPTDVATEMTVPTAAALTDPPSPDVAVAAAGSATDDAMTEGPGTGIMGVVSALPSGEPIASTYDGRPAGVIGVPITSGSDAPPPYHGRRIPSGSSTNPRSW